MKPLVPALMVLVLAAMSSPTAAADCGRYLQEQGALNERVQTLIAKALDESLGVDAESCAFRSEEWSIREEKHRAWCAGKDAAAIEQRLQQMSKELDACGADLDRQRRKGTGSSDDGAVPPPPPPPPPPPRTESCFGHTAGFGGEGEPRPDVPSIAESTKRIFACQRLSDEVLADAFAAISILLARREPPVDCFGGDAGVLHGTWEGHRSWGLRRGRTVMDENVRWKIDAAFACAALPESEKSGLYEDVMDVLRQADTGAVRRLPDLGPHVALPPSGGESQRAASAPDGSPRVVTRELPPGLGPPPMDAFWSSVKPDHDPATQTEDDPDFTVSHDDGGFQFSVGSEPADPDAPNAPEP